MHVFTSLGVVVAMLALRDVFLGDPGAAIIWLMVTIVIDGIDGPIARMLVVKERAPRVDGYVLDLIIDYVTCVIVPAAFMYHFGLVPNNTFGLVVLGAVGFTSAIWFARVDMMTDDNWFRGFPAAWNLVAPVLFLLHTRAVIGAGISLALCLASLTNLPFPHIVRAAYLRVVTLPVATIWFTAIAVGAAELPSRPAVLRLALYLPPLYFVGLCVTQAVRMRRATGPAWRAHVSGVATGSDEPPEPNS